MARLRDFVVGVSLAFLGGCSTGTVDRGTFAHTGEETYRRVVLEVPVGTDLDVARARMAAKGWSCVSWMPKSRKANTTGTFECEASPALGGYVFSQLYVAEFTVKAGRVTKIRVWITDPTI